MLVPKRVKHRREFRGKMRGAAKGGRNVDFVNMVWKHWNPTGSPTVRSKLLVSQ